jgi:DNA-binding SARP family transcriptional activator
MGQSVVLREKLRIPEAGGLSRARLERPLLETPSLGLDVVVAPAGSGKSTLLARVAARSTAPVGWYRLTADDSSEPAVCSYLGAALSALAPTEAAESIAQLLGILDRWTAPNALLILDDVHEIAGTAAEHALERFVSLRPPRLQVVCGSRRMPDVNVSRIQVSGSYREISSDDLRFRSWEVEELFASVYRQPLRPEAAAALTRRTGGWAAGLQLFHLATASRASSAERHRAVAELGGRSKLVRSYLTRNVLAELSDPYREFLLRTCTLGRLTGEACDALLEATGSHRILEHLESAQLFTSTDDGGTCFRYHEVLQTHLELALVEQYTPAGARTWYLKSAGVLESLGELRSAARAYAKAGDWVSVSRLVQGNGGGRIDATAVDGSRLLPASTWQHDPWLALADARRLVREGALPQALAAYRRAHGLYDEPAFQEMCRIEGDVVSMWLPNRDGDALVHAHLHHWSNLLRIALRESVNVGTLLGSAPSGTLDRLVRGLAALSAGEMRLARPLLESIRRADSEPFAAISASLASSVLDFIEGAEIDAGLHLTAVATAAEREGLPWLVRLCHGLEQVLLIASRDSPWRFEGCVEAIRSADAAGDGWGAGLLSIAVAIAKQHVGEDASAELTGAAERFADLDAPVLKLWCELLAIRPNATAVEARRVLATARALRARGAEALALSLLATTAPGGRESDEAIELAAQCGMTLTPPGRNEIVTAAPVAAGAARQVAITCLGGYRIELHGQPVDLTQLRPRARAVLQLLSLSPDTDHHREFLEELLWPGVDHAVACHRLQVAVSSVRSLLGDVVTIQRRGEGYRLVLPPGGTVDVCEFDAALVRAAAASARSDMVGRMTARQEALDLYRGDLLPELALSEHIDNQRGSLRRKAAAAAAAMASDCRTMGDYERALASCRRSVDLDPYPEMPWLILADLYEKVGDASSAEHTRREHARTLAELELSAP